MVVNEETAKVVSNFKKPLAIVGLVGAYRTGKSYIINRLFLNTKDGFQVGDTVEACTQVNPII